jgi:hypothetical protein
MARKSAVEAVTAGADRFAANVLPIIREAQKAGAEGDSGCAECPRCCHGTRWPVARNVCEQHT